MYNEYAVREFLKKVREENLSYDEFVARMEMISPESKKFIIERWGLNGCDYRIGPKTLNYVYKMTNAKEVVNASMKEFIYMRYVSYVRDREILGIVLSHNLGYLIERANKVNPEYFPNLGRDSICGLDLLEQIDGLRGEKDKKILKYAFGLSDISTEIFMQEKVGKEFGLSASRISSIISKCYRMLSSPRRKNSFFIPVEGNEKREFSVDIPINLSVLISNSLFIEQLETIKEKATIDNINQLQDMNIQDLMELTDLEYEICAFWILMAKKFKKKYIYERLEKSVDDLYLKKSVKDALKSGGVKTVKEFIELTLFEAKSIPKIGEKALEQIIYARARLGFPIK